MRMTLQYGAPAMLQILELQKADLADCRTRSMSLETGLKTMRDRQRQEQRNEATRLSELNIEYERLQQEIARVTQDAAFKVKVAEREKDIIQAEIKVELGNMKLRGDALTVWLPLMLPLCRILCIECDRQSGP